MLFFALCTSHLFLQKSGYTPLVRIAYVTNVRLPSERAHGHQVARVCDALAQLGHEVTIFAPFRKNVIKEDYWTFHKANRNVHLKFVGTVDFIDSCIPKFLQIHVLNWFFARALAKEISKDRFDVIYTRTPALLRILLSTGVHTVMELHTLPNVGQEKFVELCNRCALVVCLTTPMQKELARWGVEEKKTLAEGDAVDLEKFASAQAMIVDCPRPFIGYAGQIESMGLSKGIPDLLDAMKIVSKGTCLVAGAPPKNHSLLRRLSNSPHVEYLSFVENVPSLLAACDVLVYPAPHSNHPFYNRDTSPLKIFEYMAAGKPIVTADLPPIRDVLDESMAYFCKPGDSKDLARAIKEVMDHPEEAAKRAAKARKHVEHYTWDKRMQRILDVL